MCGSPRGVQKHIVLGVLEDVLGGLWSSFSLVDFLAGEAPADVSTPVGGCTESRARVSEMANGDGYGVSNEHPRGTFEFPSLYSDRRMLE